MTVRIHFLRAGKHSTGFSLVEVVLATGVVAFAIVGLIALLSLGLDASRESSEQIGAANLSTALLAERRIMPDKISKGSVSYDLKGILPSLVTTQSSAQTIESTANLLVDEYGVETSSPTEAKYTLYYQVEQQPLGSLEPANVYLKFSWPPQALQPKGSYEIVTSIRLP